MKIICSCGKVELKHVDNPKERKIFIEHLLYNPGWHQPRVIKEK